MSYTLLFLCILFGGLIGLIISEAFYVRKLRKLEALRKTEYVEINNRWQNFHKEQLSKWQADMNSIVQETADQRDRLWREKFEGKKQSKIKPNN